jgi:conjugative transfer signal peptidase TraF
MGLYAVVRSGRLARGDTVIAWAPFSARRLAALRHYLPFNVPLVKQVAAVPGDRVCASGALVTVNGRGLAPRLEVDGRGRPMPWWTGCVRLVDGDYLLVIADSPASFDGRYFGVSRGADIVGKGHLLWRR